MLALDKGLSRVQILGGKDNWIPPSYANGRLHCRSSDEIGYACPYWIIEDAQQSLAQIY